MAGDSAYLPVMLDVSGKSCVVVGGGAVAERRLTELLACGARVTVIAPEASERIQAWAHEGNLEWRRKGYESGDAADAFLVVAATNDPQINAQVRQAARLVNAVDSFRDGNVVMPSVIRRGRLHIAVSTLGASPAYASMLCRQIEGLLHVEIERYLEMMDTYRRELKRTVPDAQERRRLLAAAAAVEPEKLLSQGFAACGLPDLATEQGQEDDDD